MLVTIFNHVAARSKTEHEMTLDSLADLIRQTSAPSKDQLPLLKLAKFGNLFTKKGSLRHDGNMEWCSGVEVDYDEGKIAFETACVTFANANIAAILYTSP